MKNMKVSMKLMAGFLIVTALSVLLAGIGIFSSLSTNENYTYLLDYPVERERCVRDMQFYFSMMRYRAANFAMETENPEIITNTLTPQYKSAYDSFTANIDEFNKSNSNDERHDSAIKKQNDANAQNLKKLVDQFKDEVDKVRAIALTGDAAGATAALRDAIPITNQITTLLNEMMTPAIELVESESAGMDKTAVTLTITLAAVAVVCAVVSVILAIYISGLISKPLAPVTGFMQKAGTMGDMVLRPEDVKVISKYAQNKDELGLLIAAASSFVGRISDTSAALERIAGGDLTVELPLLSDKDTMGLAMKRMTDSLNEMFGEIHASSEQVSTGAGQVANGAQALAQGSTEQASSVQELSSSIAEVAERTKHNAEIAEQAARLADTIRGDAEKGSSQMNEMMAAVKEIHEASQSIGNVIKTIDDIAFQTNILALNAAVEAARAGQHGKSFAVVAGEVRSLAAKSAEAAHDSEALIINSMGKAELGVRIAGETSASLSGIVAGIKESSQLITEIANESEAQSLSISQINTGIDQVAQVVQQNSATAEESAAASEEMSGQSSVLRDLVSQFKLRDGNSLSSPVKPARKRLAAADESGYALSDSHNEYGKY